VGGAQAHGNEVSSDGKSGPEDHCPLICIGGTCGDEQRKTSINRIADRLEGEG